MPLPRYPRRKHEDPENEPDFYAISDLYPLPPSSDGAGKRRDLIEAAVVQQQQMPVIGVSSEKHHVALVAPPAAHRQQVAPTTDRFFAPSISAFAPAGAGLVGYDQAQFLWAGAYAPSTTTPYVTTATPQFISYPNFGSFPTIGATTTNAADTGALAQLFQTAGSPTMQYGQVYMGGGALPTAAINSSNGYQQQQFLSIGAPGVVDPNTGFVSVVGATSAQHHRTLFLR